MKRKQKSKIKNEVKQEKDRWSDTILMPISIRIL